MGQLDEHRDRAAESSHPHVVQTPAEFAAHFEESFRTLWLIAMSIVGDPLAAEDVVQEAALLALGKLGQFEPGTNFRAWMAQMVRYVALNDARKRKRQRVSPIDLHVENASLAQAERGSDLKLGRRGELPADQTYFDDQVMAALESISEVARACLLLRTLEQMEYSEISRVLQIPEGTAMSHVHRARQHLRSQLAETAAAGRGARP